MDVVDNVPGVANRHADVAMVADGRLSDDLASRAGRGEYRRQHEQAEQADQRSH
jgi:hypothetical protein